MAISLLAYSIVIAIIGPIFRFSSRTHLQKSSFFKENFISMKIWSRVNLSSSNSFYTCFSGPMYFNFCAQSIERSSALACKVSDIM